MIVPDDFAFNLLQDLRKKEINPVERAKFLESYLKHTNISQRELARQLGIPYSTLQDWISYKNITSKEYEILLDKGFGKREIYRMLRDDRGNARSKVSNAVNTPVINLLLSQMITDLRPLINTAVFDDETFTLIMDLRNVLNRMELHLEKRLKNGLLHS